MMTIGILLGRVRREERLLIAALEARGVDHELLYDDHLRFAPEDAARWQRFDAVLARSVSQSRSLASLTFCEHFGVPTVNSAHTFRVCGDKLQTSLALDAAGVPQPRLRMAFTPDAALEALEELGYPAVLKPVNGSWGRLISRVDNRDMAESILEHKAMLGVQHKIFYIQEYIPKAGSDLRAFVIGDRTICAIERRSEHWITNTARGATAVARPVNAELDAISRRAAEAVGGGAVAVDLFESERGLLVNEVNASMEFRNSIAPTGVDIAAAIIEHTLAVAGANSRHSAGGPAQLPAGGRSKLALPPPEPPCAQTVSRRPRD